MTSPYHFERDVQMRLAAELQRTADEHGVTPDEALRLAAQTLEKRRVKVPAADGAGLKPNDSGEES